VTHTSDPVEVLPHPPGVEQELTCESVRDKFFDFPNQEGNEATVSIREDRKLVYRAVFEFDGPTAIQTVPLGFPVGIGPAVIGHVAYVSNGVTFSAGALPLPIRGRSSSGAHAGRNGAAPLPRPTGDRAASRRVAPSCAFAR
jgi:hypothetical protein